MAASRKVSVVIVGDSRSVERAFARTSKAAQKTGKDLDVLRVRARRASSIGPFRLAAAGGAAGVGLFAATQAVRELGDRLAVTGTAAFTAGGKFRNMISALTSGSLVGAVEAITASRKKFEDFGISIEEVRKRQKNLKAVIAGLPPELQKQQSSTQSLGYTTAAVAQAQEQLRQAMKDAGVQSEEEAKTLREALIDYDNLKTATAALADEQWRLGQVMVTTAGAITRYKGIRPDDLKRAGRGEPVTGTRATTGAMFRPGLTPSERRELALTGQQGAARLPGLQERLRQLENMEKAALTNEELLRVSTNIASTEAEIAAVMADVAAARKAAAAAAAAAAEAARQQRIATATGWLEFGVERAEATKRISDDLKAWRDIEAYYQERIRQEGRKLELVRELWRARDRIANLNKQNGDNDALSGLRQVSTQRLTGLLAAGTGLRGAGLAALGANISGQQIVVYNTVTLDGAPIARNTTRHQARSGNRTGNQTSGRRG